MKKTFVWAMTATLLLAGSASAAGIKTEAAASGGGGAGSAFFTGAGPTTTNNDDSCDIGTAPAATLLLPYFEVDYTAQQAVAQTTLFTVTNVSQLPQIAHVTVWTDLSFPVLDFNLFLTGYDVQAINMYDIIARGVIAPASGTTNLTTPGSRSLDNDDNPNFLPSAETQCAVLPGNIPAGILADLRTGLTQGTYSTCGTARIGLTHTNAIGYVTIDVAATCSTTLPTDPTYYTGEILFDNVLVGDYEQVFPNPATGNYAQGNPMVHIRAIPEGGTAGSVALTNLPYTFYDRYTAGIGAPFNRTQDRRQPLPSTFAARWIQGSGALFSTDYKIWREGVTGPTTSCTPYAANSGTAMRIVDLVRFDEHENPTTLGVGVIISPLPAGVVVLPETSRTGVTSAIFPLQTAVAGDPGGWMYLNLNNGGSTAYSVTSAGISSGTPPTPRDFRPVGATSTTTGVRQSQNWVVVSMFANGVFGVDFDAAWLGNGCSVSPAVTNSTTNPIGPAPNITP